MVKHSSAQHSQDFQPLPTRKLGKTGVEVPLIAIGCGSRFLQIQEEEKALELLEYGLDHGFYYWDTAANYQRGQISSEERLGKLLKHRRKDVILATKLGEREGDDAKKTIERSLNRLQTDYIDLLQVHSIKSLEDVENIGKKGNVLEVLYKYKEEGIVNHIGFSGHTSAEAMKKAAEMYDFDTMLIAMNHYYTKQKFEEQAVPAAAKKGMGILAMKAVRPRENIDNLNPQDLISYALSLEHISSAVIGIDSLQILKDNIELVKNFTPLSPSRMEEIRASLTPFYNHENLAWMKPNYVDGMNVA
ncbi:aldo/keto reductase [Crocosphaera sp.]|uniref:aldo/keto reductase n=1 Tax=Crocosphaera sp. TaxID=2729996 RepID=UPI003F235D78|nr:aldo/keto reductase [Crocosphaera sp.]